MKQIRQTKWRARNHLAVVLAAFFLLLPLQSSAQSAPPLESEVESAELVWPPPPRTARIRYLQSFATPEDIGREKGVFRKLWEFIRGPEEESIRKPMAVAADDAGQVYVADPAGKMIHRFDLEAQSYHRLEGTGKEMWEQPMAVTVDSKGQLYVVDSGLRRIFLLTPDGDTVAVIGEGQLMRPTSVAVDDARGRIYVADTPEHVIKVFDTESGRLQETLGRRGSEPGRFNFPTYVGVDDAGRLYVTDSLNGRVQVFTPEGRFHHAVGKFGDGSGSFAAPKGVAVDSEGHLYVADAAFDAIQVFDSGGKLLLYFGRSGQGRGEFWMPTGLFIDGHDRLFIADSYNQRIQMFQFLGGRAP